MWTIPLSSMCYNLGSDGDSSGGGPTTFRPDPWTITVRNQNNAQAIPHFDILTNSLIPGCVYIQSQTIRSFALLAITHGSTINHLLPILSERGYPSDLAILAAACLGPTQILGRIIMLFSEKFISTQKFSIFVLPGMTLSMTVLFVSDSSTVKLMFFILIFGTSYGTISVLRPVMTRILLGEKQFGLKSGYLGSAYLLGTAIAPYFGAVMWKLVGYQGLISILFIIGILSWFTYLLAIQIFNKSTH